MPLLLPNKERQSTEKHSSEIMLQKIF